MQPSATPTTLATLWVSETSQIAARRSQLNAAEIAKCITPFCVRAPRLSPQSHSQFQRAPEFLRYRRTAISSANPAACRTRLITFYFARAIARSGIIYHFCARGRLPARNLIVRISIEKGFFLSPVASSSSSFLVFKHSYLHRERIKFHTCRKS